jgi:hypothetical protein
MIGKLKEFASLYEHRPIQNNLGGMLSPHMFLAWFALQALKPKVVIESGVFLGQGTWFFERACPDAALYCIEPNQARIRYRSSRATYCDRDFSLLDWSGIPKDQAVLFLDDHQDAYVRTRTAKWFGFKHLIFEDNFPPSRGDCYSLKKAFMHAGFAFDPPPYWSLTSKLKWHVARRLGSLADRYAGTAPNELDAAYLLQNLEVYSELPPVFKGQRTMWGDAWDDLHYPTEPALLTTVSEPHQQIYLDEAENYCWMCYARLK